jgi:hypothetical protein
MDLTGKQFGELRVISKYTEIEGNYWTVYCSCGKTKVVSEDMLRHGRNIACGHCKEDNKKYNRNQYTRLQSLKRPNKVNLHVNRCKAHAKQQHIKYELTSHYIEKLINSSCHYCGSKEKIGIDRVDSKRGYTEYNTVPCCWKCNRAKGTQPIQEFKNWVKLIADYQQDESYIALP